MTTEVACVFRTNLPEIFQVPDVTINLSTSSTAKDLTQIVKQLIEEEGKADLNDIKGKKLNFIVNSAFLTHSLQELMDKLTFTSENVVELWYSFALEKPKPTHSIPQDEWISSIKALSHVMNEKAKTYVAGFFNGDLKVFSKKDHSELLEVNSLHKDSFIQDCLFLKNDLLDKKILVSCSQTPNSELKISEIGQNNKKYFINLLAQCPEEYQDINGGFKCLSANPINNEYICSGYQGAEKAEQALLIWKLTNETLGEHGQNEVKRGNKRQKTSASFINPHSQIACGGGISSLKWQNPDTILVGCYDHSIKVVNVEKSSVEEILFSNHKVATSMDAIQDNLVLTGHEDALVRLWDLRSGNNEKKFKSQFDAHTQWISQVKFNYNVENIFLSGSLDGSVKLWDLRNEDRPLTTLSKKDKSKEDDYKVFAVEWNGASQILSGGSDSSISVHSLQ